MVTGLIIEHNNENANYIKSVIEEIEDNVCVRIMTDMEFCHRIADTKAVDFVIVPAGNMTESEILEEIIPFIRNIIDRKVENIALKKRRQAIYVDKNDIIGIEVMGKICYIHTISKGYHAFKITLGNLLELIDDPCLIRCHKSYAVNIKFVKGFKRETRTRWRADFITETDFYCAVTDLFIEDIIKVYEEYHNVEVSKFVEF